MCWYWTHARYGLSTPDALFMTSECSVPTFNTPKAEIHPDNIIQIKFRRKTKHTASAVKVENRGSFWE
jgi:hypothetical protein